jgi:hypothetical protein
MVASNLRKKDGVMGRQIETARFNLYSALQKENYTEAWDWLNALEAGLGCLENDGHPSSASVAMALKSLRQILESETEEE